MKIKKLQAKALRVRKWSIRKEIWWLRWRRYWKNGQPTKTQWEQEDKYRQLIKIRDTLEDKERELARLDHNVAIVDFLSSQLEQAITELIGPKTPFKRRQVATNDLNTRAFSVFQQVDKRCRGDIVPAYLLEAKETMRQVVEDLEAERREQEAFLAKVIAFKDESLRQIGRLKEPLTDLELLEKIAQIKAEAKASVDTTRKLIETATAQLEERLNSIRLEMKTKFGDLGERIALKSPGEGQPRQTVRVMESAIKHCLKQAER